MKKRNIIYSAMIILILTGLFFFFTGAANEKITFTYSEIQRTDISNTISSTGSLVALKTVDVGTQVSGKINRIFVDYNSSVKKGQLLAVLDTVSLALEVSDAQSNLEKAKAQYEQASAQYALDKGLYEKGYLSELDYLSSKTSLETSLADFNSSQTALQRSKTNLSYAYIYSPISGIIISKNVEEGQTVAASLSAPTLFEIAENLSNMQILASVDESDIGQIKVGQEASFTVQAYSDKNFTGKVTQIRLNSSIQDNVVSYTVVINAQNDNLLLLPGMTATIDFYIERKTNVLSVPNSALKFQPTEKMLIELKRGTDKPKEKPADFIAIDSLEADNKILNEQSSAEDNNMGSVWYLDNNGKLKVDFVLLGLTDGKKTEIVKTRDLIEGMNVITGTDGSSEETTTTTSSNVLNSRSFGGPPPR